jgi:hypothetical protein
VSGADRSVGLILATAFFLLVAASLGHGIATTVMTIGPSGVRLAGSHVLVPWSSLESIVLWGSPPAGGGMLVLNIADESVRDAVIASGFLSRRLSGLRRLRSHLSRGQCCIPLNTWRIPGDELVQAVTRFSGQAARQVASLSELRDTAPLVS